MVLSLVGCPIASSYAAFKSWMFNISPAPAALAKRSSRAFSSASVIFSRIRPPLGLGASAAPPMVISHVRAVHRAQRYPSCIGNLRLRHPAFAQQHHLDSLPDLRIFLALECCVDYHFASETNSQLSIQVALELV